MAKYIRTKDGRISYVDYEPNEEVVIPRGEQIKSANAITYDNNGVRIPLGERDNFNLKDIRWGLIPLGGTLASLSLLGNNNKNNQ